MHTSLSLFLYTFYFFHKCQRYGRLERSKNILRIDAANNNTVVGDETITISKVSKRIKSRIPIIQYHDEWVCVNKPPGISVHKTKNTPHTQQVLTSILKRQL